MPDQEKMKVKKVHGLINKALPLMMRSTALYSSTPSRLPIAASCFACARGRFAYRIGSLCGFSNGILQERLGFTPLLLLTKTLDAGGSRPYSPAAPIQP